LYNDYRDCSDKLSEKLNFDYKCQIKLNEINLYLDGYNDYKGSNLHVTRPQIEELILKNLLNYNAPFEEIIISIDNIEVIISYVEDLIINIKYTENEDNFYVYIVEDRIIESIFDKKISLITNTRIKIYDEYNFTEEYYNKNFIEECFKHGKEHNIDLSYNTVKEVNFDKFFDYIMSKEDNSLNATFNLLDAKVKAKKDCYEIVFSVVKSSNDITYINNFIHRYGNDVSSHKVAIKNDKIYDSEITYKKLNLDNTTKLEWSIDKENKLEVKTANKKIPEKIVYGYKAVKSLLEEPCIAIITLF